MIDSKLSSKLFFLEISTNKYWSLCSVINEYVFFLRRLLLVSYTYTRRVFIARRPTIKTHPNPEKEKTQEMEEERKEKVKSEPCEATTRHSALSRRHPLIVPPIINPLPPPLRSSPVRSTFDENRQNCQHKNNNRRNSRHNHPPPFSNLLVLVRTRRILPDNPAARDVQVVEIYPQQFVVDGVLVAVRSPG
jgi:hypothetical protein